MTNKETNSQSYDAFLFKQRTDSTLQVAFVAPSSEIDAWARVPTKQTGNIRNFQRAQIESHVNEVKKFFQDKHNSSPTAVVVGFDPIRSADRVTATAYAPDGNVVPAEEMEPGVPYKGTIKIGWPTDEDPKTKSEYLQSISSKLDALKAVVYRELYDICGLSAEKLEEVRAQLETLVETGGLNTEELDEHLDSDLESDGTGDSNQAEAAEDQKLSEETGGEQAHAPLSILLAESLPGLSPSEAQVALGRLVFLNKLTPKSLDKESEASAEAFYREVYDELKPGILM